MDYQKNKHHLGSSVLMSDRQKNDSLRAAQVIFQKHSDQAVQLTPTTSPTSNSGNFSLGGATNSNTLNMRRCNSQSKPGKTAATSASNRTITPPSNNGVTNYQELLPANEHAHKAALLAHKTLNPGSGDDRSHQYGTQGGINGTKHSYPHLPHLTKAFSSHNSSNINVKNLHHHANSVSVDDLSRLGFTQDMESLRTRTSPNKQEYLSESILLSSPLHLSRGAMESQEQGSRRSSEQLRQQKLKSLFRQQPLKSLSGPSSIYKETSSPVQSFPQRTSRRSQSIQMSNRHFPEDYFSITSQPVLTARPHSSSVIANDFDSQSLSAANCKLSLSQPRQQYSISPMMPITRTLSRVPPAKVSLGQAGEETATDLPANNETDTNSERTTITVKRTGSRKRDTDESSSSLVSSGSSGSYGMRSSWEIGRRTIQNESELEDNRISESPYDDYYSYEDFVDGDIAEGCSLPPRVTSRIPYDSYDFPDTSSLPNLDNVTTSTSINSIPGGPLALRLKHIQSKPGKPYRNAIKYQYQLQPQSPSHSSPKQQQQPPNVKYQGTLPDLIPNHTRKTRMERLKSKLFGSHNSKRKNASPFDFFTDRANGTSEPEGCAAKTNQNLRFKTTMRKDGAVKGINDQDQRSGGNPLGMSDYDSDSDDDSDSCTKQRDGKRNKNRGIGIRRKLKHTVPYSDHLLHMEGRHASTFNEDKPWKSHNDVGFVTSQERKRYEGMWVSNRCMYLDLLPWWSAVLDGDSDVNVQLPDDGLMLNLVVKDIWSRSNLSFDILLQIYDMVDTRRDGTLDRKSFVVGMWLVDQCLYGRKLPKEIDPKVWASVDKFAVSTISSAKVKHLDRTRKKQMKKEIKSIKKDIKNVHL